MVAHTHRRCDILQHLSVLALSSRFDGLCSSSQNPSISSLSVLALSSRFDGRGKSRRSKDVDQLSVLALSSRFDGRYTDCSAT